MSRGGWNRQWHLDADGITRRQFSGRWGRSIIGEIWPENGHWCAQVNNQESPVRFMKPYDTDECAKHAATGLARALAMYGLRLSAKEVSDD